MTIRSFLCFIPIMVGIEACNRPASENTTNASPSINQIEPDDDSLPIETDHKELVEEVLQGKEYEFDGYKFDVGYEKYDEDKFGFSNPGYLRVRKDGEVIFKDSFKGEGEVYVKSYGVHSLSGNKLVFTLNWGTEAHDYIQYSKYYVINSENKVLYLNEYWSQSGGDGYASRYYEHIFPEDSSGVPNSLLIVEGMEFHEQDQPNQSDTTRIAFDGDSFRMVKPTNNLGKVK
jgi:hypothetical protein